MSQAWTLILVIDFLARCACKRTAGLHEVTVKECYISDTTYVQDVTPRNVLLNGTRCKLALHGLNPTNQPRVGAPLFANLAMPEGK